jgi:hypothetical protein
MVEEGSSVRYQRSIPRTPVLLEGRRGLIEAIPTALHPAPACYLAQRQIQARDDRWLAELSISTGLRSLSEEYRVNIPRETWM